MTAFTNGSALVIGVGAYQDPKWQAPITARDAQGVVAALKDSAVSAYPAAQVQELYDAQATKAGVGAALRQLIDTARPTDTVTIFFCGHGLLGTDGQYYFATQDSVFGDDKLQAGTGISAKEMIDALRSIKAQKLLFIINACFSGRVAPTLGPSDVLGVPPSATLGIEILGSGEGRALITASRPTQPSFFKSSQDHTYFGQALIDGLRGNAKASDGYIGLYELYQYVYTATQTTVGAVGGVQEPVLTIMQGVGPFPVAHYPGATPGSLGAPSLQPTPPTNAAVTEVPKQVVQVLAQGAQALNVQSGGNTEINQSRGLVNFAGATVNGGVKMGDVAGDNMIKIDIKTTVAEAAAVNTEQQLRDLITQLQADVAKLTDAPKGKREDAEDDLRKAKEASEDGDKPRMLEKLESAQKILLAIGSGVPAALKLYEVIGPLLQRAMGL